MNVLRSVVVLLVVGASMIVRAGTDDDVDLAVENHKTAVGKVAVTHVPVTDNKEVVKPEEDSEESMTSEEETEGK